MAGALLGRFMLFAPFLCGYARETKFCRESHGVTYYNEVLTGHTYKSILTSGIFGCGHVCLADPRCTSYNCQTSAVGQGICELNDGEFSSKRHLVKKQGFVFVQVKWKRVSYLQLVFWWRLTYAKITYSDCRKVSENNQPSCSSVLAWKYRIILWRGKW